MTPKSNSSDGDSKEAMETSANVVSLPTGEKRKAEDPGEIEETSESEEGSETESEEEVEDKLKWGYNSFEDLEYDSSEQDQHDPDYTDKELAKKWRICARHIIETQGFFDSSLKFPECRFGGIGIVRDLDASAGKSGTIREACTRMALKCIKKYNKENKKNIKLEEILRANFFSCSLPKFYITFLAKECDESSNDAQLVEYQAKAVWSLVDIIYPLFCRPTPKKSV